MPRFERQPRTGPIPAGFLQQAFWDFERVLAGEPAFHIPVSTWIRGALDRAALTRAVDGLVERHETLRTRFVGDEHALFQVIDPRDRDVLRIEAHPGMTVEQLEAHASARAAAPFDLGHAQPLRATLYERVPGEALLSLDFHHICTDRWSLERIWSELWRRYEAETSGVALELPAHPFDYVDFSAWHRAQETELRADLAFWDRLLEGIPALALPVDRPRSASTRYRGDHVTVQVPRAVSQAFAELNAKLDVTAWMGYLAVFEALLARCSGQEDFGVGTPVSTVTRAQRGSVTGPFLNLLPIRADVRGRPSYVELVERVRPAAFEVWAHRLVPWCWLYGRGPQLLPGTSPHFQVMFNTLVSAPARAPEGLVFVDADVDVHASEFDLTLTILESPEGDVASFDYKTNLFDAGTIADLARELVARIEAVVADPGKTM